MISSRSKFTVNNVLTRGTRMFSWRRVVLVCVGQGIKQISGLLAKWTTTVGVPYKHFMLQQAYQPEHPLLPSRSGQHNGCTDLRIILMVTLPYSSIDMFVTACYFWPPGFFSLVYGVFPPRFDWSNLMTFVYCQPKISTYLILPVIRLFVLLLSVVLNSSLRCRSQGRQERVWVFVKEVFHLPPPPQGRRG
jgi:hypothetical protein